MNVQLGGIVLQWHKAFQNKLLTINVSDYLSKEQMHLNLLTILCEIFLLRLVSCSSHVCVLTRGDISVEEDINENYHLENINLLTSLFNILSFTTEILIAHDAHSTIFLDLYFVFKQQHDKYFLTTSSPIWFTCF